MNARRNYGSSPWTLIVGGVLAAFFALVILVTIVGEIGTLLFGRRRKHAENLVVL